MSIPKSWDWSHPIPEFRIEKKSGIPNPNPGIAIPNSWGLKANIQKAAYNRTNTYSRTLPEVVFFLPESGLRSFSSTQQTDWLMFRSVTVTGTHWFVVQ
jgi:hypothetical protein